MSEFSFSETPNKAELSITSLVVSGFLHFFFCIISHPLYLSYIVYFTPYILKLLFFLTPLFVTCALFLLALLTATPNYFHSELFDSRVGFQVRRTYQLVVEQFSFKGNGKDEEFGYFLQFEAYKIMLETSIFEGLEPKSSETDCSYGFEEADESVLCSTEVTQVKTLESMFKQETELEDDQWSEKRVVEVNRFDAEFDKVEVEKERASSIKEGESKEAEEDVKRTIDDDDEEEEVGYGSKLKATSQRHEAKIDKPNNRVRRGNGLGSFGSIREEKEWRKTLACKLFEERSNHNVGGGDCEGMDMLWETYENESNKFDQMKSITHKSRSKSKKGRVLDQETQKEEEDEKEEEQDMDGKVCCLQALKFSSGKVNLGMGRPNLMKISKVLKGFGWLHHVSKNGKKLGKRLT